jgi:hypothetical protein
MKKLLFLLSILTLATGTCFAADIDPGGNVEYNSTVIAKVSNNVLGNVKSSNTAFAIVLKHLNGTREFATSSTDPKIYWEAVTTTNKGTETMGLTLSASDTSDFSDWTAL